MSSLNITNVRVFDSVTGELREGPVHILDGIIEAVGNDLAAGGPAPDRPVLDGRGGTVIPGLIDAHFHAYGIGLNVRGFESRPLSYIALAATRRLARALRRGFTTVRDVAGGDPGLAAAINDGLTSSPRYLYTGPALSQTGGHGDMRSAEESGCVRGGMTVEVVDGVDAVRVAVRDRFRRGAHAIKIMASGGVVSLTDPIRQPQYSADEIRAATDEARRRGSYVAAHAYSSEAIRHAVESGVRTIEHGNLMDEAAAQVMAGQGAILVPTLVTYEAMHRRGAEVGMDSLARSKNAEVLDSGRRAVELARAAGVTIGFGTDLMGDLEDEQLAGLRVQAEVDGVVRTLQSATRVNATLIGRPDLGMVEKGAVADLVILPGNVLDDPSLLWAESRTVVQAGTVVEP
ncbi:MAG TPA: amidohydrolase family protein [Jiangellaceae bacterium]|nr:amidohydrolase family protein [Jiangellaceae bacterium]